MDNATIFIEGVEVEVLIDNLGCIDGFRLDGEPVDMRIDDSAAEFILEHMVELQEEASSVIDAWVRTHVMNPAYWGEG